MRVLSVLAVNNQVARAIIRKLHVALWPKRLDTPDLDSSPSSAPPYLNKKTSFPKLSS